MPVNHSDGAVTEGCEPILLISISRIPLLHVFLCLSYVIILFPKPLEPIRQLRSFLAALGEFADEQRERLRVSSDPESACIHRIKARVMDQLGSDILGALVVAAVHQARPSFFAFGFEYSEQHFTGNGVETELHGRAELSLRALRLPM